MSKGGIGHSWGVPGIRVSTTPNGRRYLWLSLPGTGLAWSKEIGRRSIQSNSSPLQRQPAGTKTSRAIKDQRQLTENVERPVLQIFHEKNLD